MRQTVLVKRAAPLFVLAAAGLLLTGCEPGTWQPTPGAMTDARSFHAAVTLEDGNVLVAGGNAFVDGDFVTHASAEVFSPSSGEFTPVASMHRTRYFHTGTLLATGGVLMVGGWGGANTAEVYDPATDGWTLSDLLASRIGHTATRLPDGRVLAAGGLKPDATGARFRAEIYDPVTNQWLPAKSMLHAHFEHSAVLLTDGRVLVMGGVNGESYLDEAEIYDPADNTWTPVPQGLVTPRANFAATLLSDGRVLVSGGTNRVVQSQEVGELASAEIYDPVANRFTATTGMAVPRQVQSASLLADGRVLVAGGGFNEGTPTTEVFDPATEAWSPAGSLNSYRLRHVAVNLLDGRILAVGGDDTIAPLDSAETYSPSPPA